MATRSGTLSFGSAPSSISPTGANKKPRPAPAIQEMKSPRKTPRKKKKGTRRPSSVVSVTRTGTLSFVSPCGHVATVGSVQKIGGKHEGQWYCKIKGPKVTGKSGIKTAYCPPSEDDAKNCFAKFLGIDPSSVEKASAGGTDASTVAPAVPGLEPFQLSPTPSATKKTSCAPDSRKQPSVSSERERPHDTYEQSPNNRAKCKVCEAKITKGQRRVGIQNWFDKYQKWNVSYYHERCLVPDVLAKLYLKSSPSHQKLDPSAAVDASSSSIASKLTLELNRQRDEAQSKHRIVHEERGDLWERLRQLRLAFAKRLRWEVYKIFDNKCLEDIVAKMPSTERDLLGCYGMGPKKCRQFGYPILQTIKLYRMSTQTSVSQEQDDDDDDDDIVIEATLTVDQIVDQKMKEAERKGLVFEVDA